MIMTDPLGERCAQNKATACCERLPCLVLEEIHPIGAVTRQATSPVTACTEYFGKAVCAGSSAEILSIGSVSVAVSPYAVFPVTLLVSLIRRIPLMALTTKQTELAGAIDAYVQQIAANGGGDEEILHTMSDYMEPFKQLLDMSSKQDMDLLCRQYAGFYRFAQLLEQMAQGIADGTIIVPRERKKKPRKPKPRRD